MLDWHLDYYSSHDPDKWTRRKNPPIYQIQTPDPRPLTPDPQSPTPAFHLSIREKKRILLDHIYGVDIDPQAVEVTKLSLLLKVLENETAETLGQTLRLFHERALPDLAGNIKCGNSLIGPDFYDGKQMDLFGEEERYRINAFDWRAEFPEIMKAGGFDAVIGNPPYRKERDSKELLAELRHYSYGLQYYQGKMDFWYFFLHRAIDVAKDGGYISYIVASYWLKSAGSSKLIQRVRDECRFVNVVDFGKNSVFKQVAGKHMVFVLCKTQQKENALYQGFHQGGLSATEIEEELCREDGGQFRVIRVPCNAIYTHQGAIDFEAVKYSALVQKMNLNAIPVENVHKLFRVSQGVVEAPDIVSSALAAKHKDPRVAGHGVFVVGPEVIRRYKFTQRETRFIKKYLRRADVQRYSYKLPQKYLFYIGNLDNKEIMSNPRAFPNICDHLDRYTKFITSSNAPYGIHRIRNPLYFTKPKLLCPNMFDKPCFAYCEEELYVNFAFNVIIQGDGNLSLKYLLGVLNSRFASFWFNIHGKKRGVNVDVGVGLMRQFPVHCLDTSIPRQKSEHDRIVILVDRMINLHTQLAAAKTPPDKTAIQRQIDATDSQIDRLVYNLYGLTDDEIAIVVGKGQ